MDLNHFSDYMRLNYQIFRLISETSELRGMKNFAIQNRVLQSTEGPRTTEARTREVLLYTKESNKCGADSLHAIRRDDHIT